LLQQNIDAEAQARAAAYATIMQALTQGDTQLSQAIANEAQYRINADDSLATNKADKSVNFIGDGFINGGGTLAANRQFTLNIGAVQASLEAHFIDVSESNQLISSQTGNDIVLGSDGKLFFNENITTIVTSSTGFTYTNEAGVVVTYTAPTSANLVSCSPPIGMVGADVQAILNEFKVLIDGLNTTITNQNTTIANLQTQIDNIIPTQGSVP
jgi:hypothetical protein